MRHPRHRSQRHELEPATDVEPCHFTCARRPVSTDNDPFAAAAVRAWIDENREALGELVVQLLRVREQQCVQLPLGRDQPM